MKLKYAVDIPNSVCLVDAWVTIDYFETRSEAVQYAQEMFGADEEGRIGLVSELPQDFDDDDD